MDPLPDKSFLEDLGKAWPRWKEARSELSPLPNRAFSPKPKFDSSAGWNQFIAGFYRGAVSDHGLAAITKSLSDLVPGPMQLAFTAGPDGVVDFQTTGGPDGMRFCLATMGTTSSHPLIYRCRGQVRAISDVLDMPGWRNRAMYQAAKPILLMEDALGTDLELAGGRILSACVIRDQVQFSAQERQFFSWMLPHFKVISEWLQASVEGSGLQIFELQDAGARNLANVRVRRDLFSHLHPILDSKPYGGILHEQIHAWFLRTYDQKLSKQFAHWICDPKCGRLLAVCLPPTDSQAAKVVIGR
ncbi:hypothetical protein [Puniceicoccus vermicola]|nr:hypothetical protein [Puniceicoccus vermicola]